MAYAIGEQEEIGSIPGIQETPLGDPQFRRIHGVHHYLKSDDSLFDLALRSAQQTLADSRVKKERIAKVIFATVSHYSEDLAVEKDFGGRLMHHLGLHDCFFFGMFAQNCATVAGAVRAAMSLLDEQASGDILVISADKISDSRGIGRIGPFYARSDAAVSFVITRDGYDYEIKPFAEYYDASLWDSTHANDRPRMLKSFKLNTKKVIDACLARNELHRSQISHVLCNNHDTLIWRHMSEYWDIPYERFYTRNIPRTSHCPAGDVFINLKDMDAENGVSSGANLLAFFSGPHAWTASVLRKV